MDEEKKEVLQMAIGAVARLVLFVADELEPVDEGALEEDLNAVYRVLVAAERCARRLVAQRKQN